MGILDFVQNCAKSIDEYNAEQIEKNAKKQFKAYEDAYAVYMRETFGKALRTLPNNLQPVRGDTSIENNMINAMCLNYGSWELSLYASEECRKTKAFCNMVRKELQLILDNMFSEARQEFYNQLDIISSECKSVDEIIRRYVAFYKHNFYRLFNYQLRDVNFRDGRFFYNIEIYDTTEQFQLHPSQLWPYLF